MLISCQCPWHCRIPHLHFTDFSPNSPWQAFNLSMIESRPIANTDFDVVFYLDFEGAITSPDVAKLMSELNSELSYFKFLGNYEEI